LDEFDRPNSDGIVLELERAACRLTYRSPALTFSFAPHDLLAGSVRYDLGGVGLFVTADLAPAPFGPEDVSLTVADTDVQPGRHAYHVRVVQADGEMAWSSPVYVHYEAGGSRRSGGP